MENQTKEGHNTGTINSSARDCMGYCLAKPGDQVRIAKTHRAGIRQYAACEGDTFVITKVVDDRIPYGRWLQPSGVLAARELKLDPSCCTLLTPEECGAPAGNTEPTTLRSVLIDVSDPKAAHKAWMMRAQSTSRPDDPLEHGRDMQRKTERPENDGHAM